MRDLELMVKDYRLTTAEILYHLPDHPSLLQTYVLISRPNFLFYRNFWTFGKRRLKVGCTVSKSRRPS